MASTGNYNGPSFSFWVISWVLIILFKIINVSISRLWMD